jgi:hypothetical protein
MATLLIRGGRVIDPAQNIDRIDDVLVRDVHRARGGRVPVELGGGGEAARISLVLDDVDRADKGAAPEQGRLRPLRNFNPGVVKEFDVRAAGLGDGNAILEDRDAGLHGGAPVIGGDAANDEPGIVRRLVLDLKTRDKEGELFELLDTDLVQEGSGIGGQGDRDVEGPLFALLCGDDQFLNIARSGRLASSDLGICAGKRKQCR